MKKLQPLSIRGCSIIYSLFLPWALSCYAMKWFYQMKWEIFLDIFSISRCNRNMTELLSFAHLSDSRDLASAYKNHSDTQGTADLISTKYLVYSAGMCYAYLTIKSFFL